MCVGGGGTKRSTKERRVRGSTAVSVEDKVRVSPERELPTHQTVHPVTSAGRYQSFGC